MERANNKLNRQGHRGETRLLCGAGVWLELVLTVVTPYQGSGQFFEAKVAVFHLTAIAFEADRARLRNFERVLQ